MGVFYKNTSKRHLQRLIDERDYYLWYSKSTYVSKENRSEYALMADLYETLIKAAQKHIAKTMKIKAR